MEPQAESISDMNRINNEWEIIYSIHIKRIYKRIY